MVDSMVFIGPQKNVCNELPEALQLFSSSAPRQADFFFVDTNKVDTYQTPDVDPEHNICSSSLGFRDVVFFFGENLEDLETKHVELSIRGMKSQCFRSHGYH